MSEQTTPPREFWIVSSSSLGEICCDTEEEMLEILKEEGAIKNNNVIVTKVIEHPAYVELQKQVEELTKTLRDYEHECETVNEMKAQLTAEREKVKTLRDAILKVKCTGPNQKKVLNELYFLAETEDN